MAARWDCSRESTARWGWPDLRRTGSHMGEGAYVQEANKEPRPWGELTCSSSDLEKCPALGAWGGGCCAGCRPEVRCARESSQPWITQGQRRARRELRRRDRWPDHRLRRSCTHGAAYLELAEQKRAAGHGVPAGHHGKGSRGAARQKDEGERGEEEEAVGGG
ncbi:uncharacterized protein [Zea mays]|uniref:Uncharacterized protein n=1 Tax=Zea mays TaxID=4577 RepID=C0P963_MAIZE|nr:uncharacterized protein LOC100382587 [Zea mays]ACN30708.1 unknown [Zea mays]AQK70433.1 hypothetical protein ZEAMMB73_Zm00001d016291 [Zea mays]|eukprot:XP_020394096.1 uncharacterized protein LOC100382587 [Zea mays]